MGYGGHDNVIAAALDQVGRRTKRSTRTRTGEAALRRI